MLDDRACIIVVDAWADNIHEQKDKYFHNILLFLENTTLPVILASHDGRSTNKQIGNICVPNNPILLNNGAGYKIYKHRLFNSVMNIKPEVMYNILIKNHITILYYVGMSTRLYISQANRY